MIALRAQLKRLSGLFGLLLLTGLCLGAHAASSAPAAPSAVAWVAYSKGAQIVLPGAKKPVPLATLSTLGFGSQITLQKGDQLSVVVFSNNTRRVYDGPANLKVIKDTVSLRSGPEPEVFPASNEQLAVIQKWLTLHPKGLAAMPSPPGLGKLPFDVIKPLEGALFLSRQPEFLLTGTLPRDAKLIIYDKDNRRFWVEPLENSHVTFPPAAEFQWGQSYSWEIRNFTGGSLLKGKFKIASEQQAFQLFKSKVPNLPSTPKIDLVLYALTLQMAGAYPEAQDVWATVHKLQ